MSDKEGFIYVWYDVWRKMYYIGCHWGRIDDGYVCSSDRMRKAYRRRPNDFRRRIIQRNIPREILLGEEYKWLQLIPKEQLGKKYYNLSVRHFGHWSNNSDTRTIRQKISEAGKGRIVSEETKKKMSSKRKGKPSHEWSDVSREKMRQHNLGKKHSPEHIRARADSIRNAGHKRKHVECPKCHEVGPVNVMARWHFEKCTGPKPEKQPKPRALLPGKDYEITYPDGSKEVISNLSNFCKINNISRSALKKVMAGKQEHFRGITCRKITR